MEQVSPGSISGAGMKVADGWPANRGTALADWPVGAAGAFESEKKNMKKEAERARVRQRGQKSET